MAAKIIGTKPIRIPPSLDLFGGRAAFYRDAKHIQISGKYKVAAKNTIKFHWALASSTCPLQ